MDLSPFEPWLKLLHLAGAFVFAAGHGVSVAVAFRLRVERERSRMLALLDLSASSLSLAFIGLLALLIGGILAGIARGDFSRGWVWASIVLLVVISALMTPIVGQHFTELRQALGQRTRTMKAGEPDPVALPIEEVIALTRSRRPEAMALIGGIGFLVILSLMTLKPF
jgi:MFS family permease